MFEKEAKEYTKKRAKILGIDDHCLAYHAIQRAYQYGAEYGYKMANEWHFVKDELPPIKKEYNGRSELVLVLSKENEMQYAQYVKKEKTWARGICAINFEPYAWREITIPELGLQMPMQEG